MSGEADTAGSGRGRSDTVGTGLDRSPASRRERLLLAVAAGAERLLQFNLDADVIVDALGVFGHAAEAARVCVVHVEDRPEFSPAVRVMYVWPPRPAAPASGSPDELVCGRVRARWFAEARAGHSLFERAEDCPAAEAAWLTQQGMAAVAVVPVPVDGRVWGLLEFDYAGHEAEPWTHETAACLQPAGAIVGAAIARLNGQRRKEHLLVEHEQLVESLDDVVFRFGTDGRWTFLNPAWGRRLGFTVPACLGRAAVRFVHPEERSAALASWREVLEGRREWYRGEVRFAQASGGYRWMLVAARQQRSADGAFAGVTGTLTDVTEAKAAEMELIAARKEAEAAKRATNEFLSTMSHELRTPLNAVIGLSDSLLETGVDVAGERGRRYLEIIRQSGRQLLAQINDILDLVRIESGRTVLRVSQVNLEMLCASASEAVQHDLLAKSLTLNWERPAADVLVEADERLLRQVLHNLLSNAVKFTPPGGRIGVNVGVAGDQAVIAVSDTGVGIAPEKMDRLFKPFFQIDASMSRSFGGTGLGLALVERIVRLHRGRVHAQSSPGIGSTFTVELPVAAR